jgi:hypothetical protein
MHIMPMDRLYEVLRSRRITMFRGSHFVHTEGVTGSIPVTPTIFSMTYKEIAKRSTGLAKPERR